MPHGSARAVIATCLLWLCCTAPIASAQQFPLPRAAVDDAALPRTMPALARQVLAAYHDDDRDAFLNNRFRLQIVAGQDRDAVETIRALRALRAARDGASAATQYLQYEVYADAKARQATAHASFDAAFRQSFRAMCGALDDASALQALTAFDGNLQQNDDELHKALAQRKDADTIALADALALLKTYQIRQVYAEMQPLAPAWVAEDDGRRYAIERDVLIATPDGGHAAAMVVRPKSLPGKRTTLLEYTIYANDDWSLFDAKMAAAHGYVGVVVYTRGKGASPDAIEPYEHDGSDAAATIDWIAAQPWSDGRVGMYGGSYNSFAQWAAAKHHPAALKALMTSASTAPGIDVPMEGNVSLGFVYPWAFYVGDNKALDDGIYGDQKRWEKLAQDWYASGRAWRDLDRIDGKPNPVFGKWLQHPSYDAWWQAMIPCRDEFAGIDIPVLSTTGYFDGGQVGALYYFDQHTTYRPQADHTLVIGPFGHFSMQSGVAPTIDGYDVDAAAMIDLQKLRFDWFDHVFKGTPKPELLQDRVNYEVMGANAWRHAHTLEAMANASQRLYLDAGQGGTHRLAAEVSAHPGSIDQRVDFADRKDAAWTSPMDAITPKLDPHGGLVFAGDPLKETTEVEGLFSGVLDFVANKRDLDIDLALYEQMPDGRYFQLAYWLARASYAQDRTQRHLLVPGKRQHLAFRAGRITARQLQPGSRLVVVLSVPKESDQQINYGTGGDVSAETVADAKQPLRVRWFGNSHIDVPTRK